MIIEKTMARTVVVMDGYMPAGRLLSHTEATVVRPHSSNLQDYY